MAQPVDQDGGNKPDTKEGGEVRFVTEFGSGEYSQDKHCKGPHYATVHTAHKRRQPFQ